MSLQTWPLKCDVVGIPKGWQTSRRGEEVMLTRKKKEKMIRTYKNKLYPCLFRMLHVFQSSLIDVESFSLPKKENTLFIPNSSLIRDVFFHFVPKYVLTLYFSTKSSNRRFASPQVSGLIASSSLKIRVLMNDFLTSPFHPRSLSPGSEHYRKWSQHTRFFTHACCNGRKSAIHMVCILKIPRFYHISRCIIQSKPILLCII